MPSSAGARTVETVGSAVEPAPSRVSPASPGWSSASRSGYVPGAIEIVFGPVTRRAWPTASVIVLHGVAGAVHEGGDAAASSST